MLAHYANEITIIDNLIIRKLTSLIAMSHCPQFVFIQRSVDIYCCCVRICITDYLNRNKATKRDRDFHIKSNPKQLPSRTYQNALQLV